MVRNVTLKPLNSVTKVSPTSLTIDAIVAHCSKVTGSTQITAARRARRFAAGSGSSVYVALRSFARRSHRRGLVQPTLACNGGDDLTAVKAAIFDENLRRIFPADHHSRQVDSGDVALERVGIAVRPSRVAVGSNPLPFDELEIGVVASHRKDLHSWHGDLMV